MDIETKLIARLQAFDRKLRTGEPMEATQWVVCPQCDGDGCDRCKGRGCFPQRVYFPKQENE